jgi:hypothetical protein
MSSFAQHLDCIVSLGIDLLNQLSSIGAQLPIRVEIVFRLDAWKVPAKEQDHWVLSFAVDALTCR